MAPFTKLRTYQKKSVLHRRSSIEAFNALFAENLCKRKEVETCKRTKSKKPIEIPELPPPDANHHLIEDSTSRSFRFEDTFDRLRKEPVYNTKSTVAKAIADNSQPGNQVTFSNTVDAPAIYNTRSRSGNGNIEDATENSFKKPEKTLDKSVNISLFIEKVPKYEPPNINEITSLSTPSQGQLDSSYLPQICDTAEIPYEPVFSNTFRERAGNKLHIASTPAAVSSTPIKHPFVINETFSPILNCVEPKSLIEKSYEEIDKWNYKAPDAFESTPLSCLTSKLKKKKAKSKKPQRKAIQKAKHCTSVITISLAGTKRNGITNNFKDVKLNSEPKVMLDKTLDILGISTSVKINLSEDLKGFSGSEMGNNPNKIVELKKAVQVLEESLHRLSTPSNSSRKAQNNRKRYSSKNADITKCTPNVPTPVRYLALRKRTVAITRGGIKQTTKKTDSELSTSKQTFNYSHTMETSKSPSFSPNKSRRKINESVSKLIAPRKTPSRKSTKSPPQLLNSPCSDHVSTPPRLRSQNRASVGSKSQERYSLSNKKKALRKTIGSPDVIPDTPLSKPNSKTYRTKKLKNVSKNIFADHSYCSKNRTDFQSSSVGSADLSQSQTKGFEHKISNFDVRETINDSKSGSSIGNDSNNSVDDIISLNSDDDLFDDAVECNAHRTQCEEISFKQERSGSLGSSSNNENVVELGHNSSFSSVLEFHNYSKELETDADDVIQLSSSDEECIPNNDYESPQCNTSAQNIPENLHARSNSGDISFEETDTTVEELAVAAENEVACTEFKVNKITSSTPVNFTAIASDTLFVIDQENEECHKDMDEIFAIPIIPRKPKPVLLKPGKLWRRSLLQVRRSSVMLQDSNCVAENGCVCACTKCRSTDSRKSNFSIYGRQQSYRILPQSPLRTIRQSYNASILENYAVQNLNSTTYGPNSTHDTVYPERSIGEPVILKPRNSSLHELTPHEVAREIVLRRCGQTEPLPFEECYPPSLLRNCFKIGEGVYGEVFLFRNSSGGSSVMKVIPIEGNQLVNGEQQKKFDEILSEIVIAMELSNLRNDKKNKTTGFSEVQKIRCVQGCYPEELLELWNLYEETHGSENDSPELFEKDQLYIVLELANGGKDMEAFVFKNSVQAYALFQQTACALAIAESSLEFEHRDLHWGNVLISLADKNKKLTYCLNGQELVVPACGIEVSIIDFTLSRIKYDGVVIYNDISKDPDLFTATGDYQFEVYKLMQKQNENEWEHFEPYTNILWLHYILDKMISALRYSSVNTKVHKGGIIKLRELKDRIMKYSSVIELVTAEFAM